MNAFSKPKTIQGKYQIAKNRLALCFLEVVEETEQALKLRVRLNKDTYTTLPRGAKIFLDTLPSGEKPPTEPGYFESLSTVVQMIDPVPGSTPNDQQEKDSALHLCSSLVRLSYLDLRMDDRGPVDFSLTLNEQDIVLKAKSGHLKGLSLQYTAENAMTSLVSSRSYDFSVSYKETTLTLPGRIRHIQYNWESFQHEIGISFSDLNEEQEMILNLLIDPNYTVALSEKQTINPGAGKIS